MSHTPLGPEVEVGQVRADRKGGTIIVRALTPSTRYLCEYPQLDGECTLLGEQTIRELYVDVVSVGRESTGPSRVKREP